jgi:hypothetical protein
MKFLNIFASVIKTRHCLSNEINPISNFEALDFLLLHFLWLNIDVTIRGPSLLHFTPLIPLHGVVNLTYFHYYTVSYVTLCDINVTLCAIKSYFLQSNRHI